MRWLLRRVLLCLDRIAAVIIFFVILLFLYAPAKAQPYAYAVESSDPATGMRAIQCVYSLADAKAEYSWMTGPRRIIPIREPMPRAEVGRLWTEAKRQAVGLADPMSHMLIFGDLLTIGEPTK